MAIHVCKYVKKILQIDKCITLETETGHFSLPKNYGFFRIMDPPSGLNKNYGSFRIMDPPKNYGSFILVFHINISMSKHRIKTTFRIMDPIFSKEICFSSI